MSMENAILKHAEALMALSESLNTMNAGRAGALALPTETIKQSIARTESDIKATGEKVSSAREAISEAQAEDAAANAERKEAEDNQVGPTGTADAELEAAVTQVEDDAKAEAAALDYHKDVKPVLLALVKAKQKPALVDLLAKYNAKTGEQIKADDFAAIVADANALIAA